jgi:uncharacterized membrane protein YoaK (UPF0700 family)
MKYHLFLLLFFAPSASYAKQAPSRLAKPSLDLQNSVDAAISKVRNELEIKYDDAVSTFADSKDSSLHVVAPPSQKILIRVGCLLAANSGFLNGLGLSGLLEGRKQTVAAVTGAYTTASLAIGGGDGVSALVQVVVILSYLGGSMINGLMNPNGINWSKKPTALLVAATLVLLGALDYYATERFFILLALALGLQNSWTSMLISGNVLRSCHFSGCTSDMGTFLGQVLRGNAENRWKIKIFASLAASFWAGGIFSVVTADRLGELSFFGSVCVYVALWKFLTPQQQPSASGVGAEKMM